jgi:hypothetical protein
VSSGFSRDNIVLGTGIGAEFVSVVPNAIDSEAFQPKVELEPSASPTGTT